MVPGEPASSDCPTARKTMPEASRPLRLLRNHGQHLCVEPFSVPEVRRVWRKWLQSPQAEEPTILELVCQTTSAVSDTECGGPSTRCVVSEAKVSLEQPYAVIL